MRHGILRRRRHGGSTGTVNFTSRASMNGSTPCAGLATAGVSRWRHRRILNTTAKYEINFGFEFRIAD